MNPQTNDTNTAGNGLSLPPVSPAPAPANPSPAASQPAPPASAAAAQPATSADPSEATTADGTPLIADDADLIEKAWVEKAKSLVDQTKGDPYKQNQEINKFKADYIKKRYNKDIILGKD